MNIDFLVKLSGSTEESVRQTVQRLLDGDFLARVRQPGAGYNREYTFKHEVVREVALTRMARRSRLRRHLQAAEFLQSLPMDSAGDRAEFLAFHYQSALELLESLGEELPAIHGMAIDAFSSAGDKASELGIAQDAVEHFKRAMALCEADDTRLPEIMLRCGRAQLHMGFNGLALIKQARDGLRRLRKFERAAEADVLLAGAAIAVGDKKQADDLIVQALELARDADPSPSKMSVLITCAAHLCLQGRYFDAIDAGNKAIAIADERSLPSKVARALTHVGVARVMIGEQEGILDIERSIKIQKDVGAPVAAVSYSSLAYAHANIGDIDKVKVATEMGFGAATSQWAGPERIWLRGEKAFCDYWEGNWDAVMITAEEFSTAKHRHFMESSVRSRRAIILLARGQTEQAFEESAQALHLAEMKTAPIGRPVALAVHALCLMRLNLINQASARVHELIQYQHGKILDPAFGIDLPVLLKSLGYTAEILDELELRPTRWLDAARAYMDDELAACTRLYGTIGSRPDEAASRLRAAEVLISRGDMRAARNILQLALEFYEPLSATYYLQRIDELIDISNLT